MRSVSKAAEVLCTTEYRIFSEAYLLEFGDRPDTDEINQLFSRFMMFGEMPVWADRFARDLLSDIDTGGSVNLNTFCLVNLSPRININRSKVSFSIMHAGDPAFE